jgi:hypothetical protein
VVVVGHAADERRAGGGARHWHRGLVVAELALAQMVVIAAWLLTTSLGAATRVPLGYDTAGRVAAELTLATDRYGSDANRTAAANPPVERFVSSVLESMERQAGVRGVAAAFTAPLSGAPNRGIRIVGAPEPPGGQEPNADFQVVTPGFFTTLGLSWGRAPLAATDDRRLPVVVVNKRSRPAIKYGLPASSVRDASRSGRRRR